MVNLRDDFELVRLQDDGNVLQVRRVFDLRWRQLVGLVIQFIGYSYEIQRSDSLREAGKEFFVRFRSEINFRGK